MFDFAIVTIGPHRGGHEMHTHDAEDDAFYILDGELVFTFDGEEIVAGAGTLVLVPPAVPRTFGNRTDAAARVANVHAPAGFDLRLAEG